MFGRVSIILIYQTANQILQLLRYDQIPHHAILESPLDILRFLRHTSLSFSTSFIVVITFDGMNVFAFYAFDKTGMPNSSAKIHNEDISGLWVSNLHSGWLNWFSIVFTASIHHGFTSGFQSPPIPSGIHHYCLLYTPIHKCHAPTCREIKTNRV